MNRKIRSILQLLLVAGLCVPLYILLHELGQLFVMLSAGATIEDFSILRAHVIASGGNYSKAGELWLHANGACLPVICLIVYLLLFYKKDHMNPFYHFFSYVVALFPIGSTLAWVIIPFLYINGNAPVRDDVTKFLNVFSQDYHPLVVSAVAAITIGICIVIILKKDIIRTTVKIVKQK